MRVNYVKTEGFRKFKKIFEADLYDITSISGKNRSGKSNLLYAIINIMLGTNLSGDEKPLLAMIVMIEQVMTTIWNCMS